MVEFWHEAKLAHLRELLTVVGKLHGYDAGLQFGWTGYLHEVERVSAKREQHIDWVEWEPLAREWSLMPTREDIGEVVQFIRAFDVRHHLILELKHRFG